MSDLGRSTIAQLLFLTENSIDFARVVAELGSVLTRLQSQEVQFAWDCEDLVCFDIPGTRIHLAWSEVDRRGYARCLTVAVGPPDHGLRNDYEDMCSRLVDRICSRFDPVAVLWCQAEGTLGSDVIDALLDALPNLGSVLPDIDSVVATLTAQEARLVAGQDTPPPRVPKRPAMARARHPAPTPPPQVMVANDIPDLPRLCDTNIAHVRAALYPEPEADPPYSTQMRLAVHCMNATLIVVWAPMGAALMTYSLLKGENMRLSSRMMAVAGTVFALAHSPFGVSVAAMASAVG